MKQSILLVLGSILLLCGCQKEPMIHLSEAKKSEINAKVNQEKEKTSNELATGVKTDFDSSTFTPYDESKTFDDISQFLIAQPNQRKKLSNQSSVFSLYMDYVDGGLGLIQMREVNGDKVNNKYYSWNAQQMIQLANEKTSAFPMNHLNQVHENPITEMVLLQAPLTKGTSWQAADGIEATITNLYKEIKLTQGTFHDVIEVTYHSADYEIHYYYAKNNGVVAIWQIPASESEKQQHWQVTDMQMNAKMTQAMPIYRPDESNKGQVTLDSIDMSWQTNDQVAMIYTRLFQTLGWISENITVNSVLLDNDVLMIDFSSGVVAAINQHPATEAGVIPAMVETLASHFGVKKVKLSVNGLGLLPDNLPYPDGGVWTANQVNENNEN
ncbi:GerMN domain-containing protein [Tuanshanicoccus lijuaniae]|uniref:GerMN domain-containing protein n=1 Tax=Aerococcaceae bacterium zg-1292 TaxID=2774330 RepID=UPI001BD8F337|nr:GerMN domain-containing protein [Aerococcaceae bacterium zg-A91]MBS4458255.1 GerMN domain-containing protein [Aerococcaceae bacterium zg-BR33]